jgi:hypothetical protein
MQSHSYPHCVGCQKRALRRDCRCDGIKRTVENDEKAVPLDVDPVPTMSLHGFT